MAHVHTEDPSAVVNDAVKLEAIFLIDGYKVAPSGKEVHTDGRPVTAHISPIPELMHQQINYVFAAVPTNHSIVGGDN